jgi:hypothetical protein
MLFCFVFFFFVFCFFFFYRNDEKYLIAPINFKNKLKQKQKICPFGHLGVAIWLDWGWQADPYGWNGGIFGIFLKHMGAILKNLDRKMHVLRI